MSASVDGDLVRVLIDLGVSRWNWTETRSCRFAYAEDLQPRRVFLGNVPDKIYAFDIALRRIALGEID
jgi:hypothetical protein